VLEEVEEGEIVSEREADDDRDALDVLDTVTQTLIELDTDPDAESEGDTFGDAEALIDAVDDDVFEGARERVELKVFECATLKDIVTDTVPEGVLEGMTLVAVTSAELLADEVTDGDGEDDHCELILA